MNITIDDSETISCNNYPVLISTLKSSLKQFEAPLNLEAWEHDPIECENNSIVIPISVTQLKYRKWPCDGTGTVRIITPR